MSAGGSLPPILAEWVRQPLGPRRLDQRDHLLRRAGGDGAAGGHRIAFRTPQELVERLSGPLSGDVPERDVDGGLGIPVAGQREVHQPVEAVDVARVPSLQHGREQRDGEPRAGAEGGQVAVAPGAALTPAGEALVGVDAHERRVERLERKPAAGQPVGFDERQGLLPHRDARDSHGLLTRIFRASHRGRADGFRSGSGMPGPDSVRGAPAPVHPAFAAPPHDARTATRCIVLLRYPFGFQSMAWGCITPSLSVARAQSS